METRTVQNPTEELSLTQQVLIDKQKELAEVKHQILCVQADIQNAKAKWDAEKVQQEIELRKKKKELQLDYDKRVCEVEELKRVADLTLQRTKQGEAEFNQRLMSVVEREEKVANLNKERVEIHQLRTEAERMIYDAQQEKSDAQTLYNKAQSMMDEAKRTLFDCEKRNQQMNDEWNKLHAWQEELELKAKNIEIIKKEVDSKLEKPKEEVKDVGIREDNEVSGASEGVGEAAQEPGGQDRGTAEGIEKDGSGKDDNSPKDTR